MKLKIRTLLFTLAALTFYSFNGICQATDLKNFIGYWTTDSSSVRTVIFKDKDDNFQMVIWDKNDCEMLEVSKIKFKDNELKATEKTKSTNWETHDTYTIKDKNTLNCAIEREGGVTNITLVRVK